MKAPLTLLLLTLTAAAQADTIGRTRFTPPPAWQPLTQYSSLMQLNQGEHSMTLQHKAYVLPDAAGKLAAVLLISSTDGGYGGRISWVSEICPEARPRYFAQDFGSNKQTRVRECLIVNSAFAPLAFFKPEAEVLRALATHPEWQLFKSGYSLRSVYGAEGGTLLRVNLMTVKGLKGLPGSPEASDLHEVPAGLIALGEALHREVRRSVLSLGGEFQLPPVRFAD